MNRATIFALLVLGVFMYTVVMIGMYRAKETDTALEPGVEKKLIELRRANNEFSQGLSMKANLEDTLDATLDTLAKCRSTGNDQSTRKACPTHEPCPPESPKEVCPSQKACPAQEACPAQKQCPTCPVAEVCPSKVACPEGGCHVYQPPPHTSKNIVLLTYASHGGSDDRFCRSVESMMHFGMPFKLLGWGMPWKGLVSKIFGVQAELDNWPDDHLVVFADAYDVIYVGTVDELVKTYRAMNKPIVFAGEKGCWPLIMKQPDGESQCLNVYPKAPEGNPYRYINTGLWISEVRYARVLFERVRKGIIEGNKENDQEAVQDIFVFEKDHNISLDYFTEMFQCVHMSEKDLSFPNGRPYNVVTKKAPMMLHFNGGSKPAYPAIEGSLWYKDKKVQRAFYTSSPTGGSLINTHQLAVPFEDICPDYVRLQRDAALRD